MTTRTIFQGGIFILALICFAIPSLSLAQEIWPKIIEVPEGKITIYQPQPESLNGNKLTSRGAISITRKGETEPIFGAMWSEATIEVDRDDRSVTLESLKITQTKFPGVTDTAKIRTLNTLIETDAPTWKLNLSLDQLLTTLEEGNQSQDSNLGVAPPRIIYSPQTAILVSIDGEPLIRNDERMGVERVINTPFLLVRSNPSTFFLYGGEYWFVAGGIPGPWVQTEEVPQDLRRIETSIKESGADSSVALIKPRVPKVIISTEPAELIQSDGDANLAPIEGTGLLYVTNSTDDIFMEIEQQHYYVLLTGRWYAARTLQGPWTFVASDKLPADFARIPEGSEKDVVLASVAGTPAAQDAVLDAQIPQTAKVDRKKATTTVVYDGDPKFEKIEGTAMSYAINTESTVILSDDSYYCVEEGVWFVSKEARGPWEVATTRPDEIAQVPADSPVYNTKYVYIYDVTTTYVYMGYTPGYVGTYVYGPTVVYGTGYYYAPWYGAYYYPRPVTWGFNMHYNPWTGWSMGVSYSTGWFHVGFSTGGWWGPPVYRPPYHIHHHHYYGGRPVHINNNVNINNTNNIYNHRGDVTTRQRGNSASQRAGGGAGQPGAANNVITDRSGNVYQRDNKGQWNQNNGKDWSPAQGNRDLDRQQQMRDRGNSRANSFQNANRGGGMGARAGGGGRRR